MSFLEPDIKAIGSKNLAIHLILFLNNISDKSCDLSRGFVKLYISSSVKKNMTIPIWSFVVNNMAENFRDMIFTKIMFCFYSSQ